ncbi:MAG: tRNA pseudouridine(55) synthase TruB [Phycisphaerales bacterium]|nr:tRNA pseudouridine(55) synthase TruB [Phycisphaerales bacterium]
MNKSCFESLNNTLLLVNKPLGWTSFDVVNKIRNHTGISKVGHAGTLDPLATGLLLIATGNKTKEISQYVGLPKTYVLTMTLGATTPSYDLETPIENIRPFDHCTKDCIALVLEQYKGVITQKPPIYSAIKKNGKPLYLSARKGLSVTVDARQVEIYELLITNIQLPEITIIVTCSSGTYMRSLVHDIGQSLDCGAFVKSLQRTAIGNFLLEDSKTIEDITSINSLSSKKPISNLINHEQKN